MITNTRKNEELIKEVQESLQNISPFVNLEQICDQGATFSNPLKEMKCELDVKLPSLPDLLMPKQLFDIEPKFNDSDSWLQIILKATSNSGALIGFTIIFFVLSRGSSKNSKIFRNLFRITLGMAVMQVLVSGFFTHLNHQYSEYATETLTKVWEETKEDDPLGEDIDMDEIEVVESQSGFPVEATATTVLMLLSIGVGCKPKNPALFAVKDFLKNTQCVKDNTLSAVTAGISGLRKLCDKLHAPDTIKEWFEVPVDNEAVHDWTREVSDFITTVSLDSLQGYDENSKAYEVLNSKYIQLTKTVQRGSPAMVCLNDSKRNLDKCRTTFERRFRSLKGYRPEPVMVVFYGKPATMKSTLCNQFSDLLNELTLNPVALADYRRDPDAYIYRRSVDKWWDVYSPKANVIIMDDYLQMVDPGNNPSESEAALTIKIVNCEEFAVPTAAADTKNSLFCRANFLVTNTNISDLRNVHSIHDKEALERRWHFHVKVEISEKYLKEDGSVDFSLLPHMEHNGMPIEDAAMFVPDFWKLKVREVVGARLDLPYVEMSVEELLERAVIRHYKHLKWYEINKAASTVMRDRMRSSMQERINGSKIQVENIREKLRKRSVMPGEFVEAQGGDFDIGSDGAVIRLMKLIGKLSHDDYFKLVNALLGTLSMYDKNCIFEEEVPEKFFMSLEDHQAGMFIHYLQEHLSDVNRGASVHISGNFKGYLQLVISRRNDNKLFVLTGEKKPVFTFESLSNKFSESFSTCLSFVYKYKFTLAFGLAALAGVVYYIRKAIESWDMPESHSGDTSKYMAKGPSRTPGKARTAVSKPKEQSITLSQGLNPNNLEWKPNDISFKFGSKEAVSNILTSVVDKYMFIMYIRDDTGPVCKTYRLGQAINVSGPYMLCCYHYILKLEDYIREKDANLIYVTFVTPSNNRKFSKYVKDVLLNVTSIQASEENDNCLIKVGNEQNAVGAKKFFVSKKDVGWRRKNRTSCSVIGSHQVGPGKDSLVFRVLDVMAEYKVEETIIRATWTSDSKNSHYAMSNTMHYDGNFTGGDCGSIVVLKEGYTNHKVILGMHIAGNSKIGYSNIVTQEDIEELLDHVDDPIIEFTEEIEPQGLSRIVIPDLSGNFSVKKPHGVFDKSNSVPTCTKSDLVKSLLFGKIKDNAGVEIQYPALLRTRTMSDGTVLNPKEKALNNYARFPVPIASEPLNEAKLSYLALLYKYDDLPTSSKTVYSVEEALSSFGKHVHSIAPSTSGGWPYTTPAGEDLKKMYYNAIRDEDWETRDIALKKINLEIEEIERNYDDGKRPVFIYSDALKLETRSLEKVISGSTRMFSGSPFSLLLMFRRYFGVFMDEFFDKNLKVGSAIGINPYSTDWDDLARKLLQFNNSSGEATIGAGDYSKFDCSEMPDVLNAILDIINAWYGTGGRDSLIRQYLWREITHSRHIFEGEYYEWCTGIPSGCAITAPLNTIYSQLNFRMCWWYAGLDVKLFNDMTYVVGLGDDQAYSVAAKYRDVFNELTMPRLMSYVGMTYTTEDKGTASMPFRKITEIDFLKRAFRQIRYKGVVRWIAPIKMDSMINMLYWSKKQRRDEITLNNIFIFYRELALHGKEVFEPLFKEVNDLRRQYLSHEVSQNKEYIGYRDTLEDVLHLEHSL